MQVPSTAMRTSTDLRQERNPFCISCQRMARTRLSFPICSRLPHRPARLENLRSIWAPPNQRQCRLIGQKNGGGCYSNQSRVFDSRYSPGRRRSSESTDGPLRPSARQTFAPYALQRLHCAHFQSSTKGLRHVGQSLGKCEHGKRAEPMRVLRAFLRFFARNWGDFCFLKTPLNIFQYLKLTGMLAKYSAASAARRKLALRINNIGA